MAGLSEQQLKLTSCSCSDKQETCKLFENHLSLSGKWLSCFYCATEYPPFHFLLTWSLSSIQNVVIIHHKTVLIWHLMQSRINCSQAIRQGHRYLSYCFEFERRTHWKSFQKKKKSEESNVEEEEESNEWRGEERKRKEEKWKERREQIGKNSIFNGP